MSSDKEEQGLPDLLARPITVLDYDLDEAGNYRTLKFKTASGHVVVLIIDRIEVYKDGVLVMQ